MIVTSACGMRMHDYFKQISQLNPFDAVIIVKDDQLVAYNEKAGQLFATEHITKDTLQIFFGKEQLERLKESLHQSAITLRLDNIGELHCSYSIMTIDGCDYNLLIIRNIASNVNEHRNFVQEYKDAIVAINLQGEVIYWNHACGNLLSYSSKQSTSQLFEKWVHVEYREEVKKIIQQTFIGQNSVVANCLMNLDIFKYSRVSIQVIPTFYEQKVIGAHIIIKKAQLFHAQYSFYQQAAYVDELTGLPNRRALHEQWKPFENSEIEQPIALMLIDIDRFKKFNESIGKQKTDELLATISKRLYTINQTSCHVFHYNGDEFVVIMQGYSKVQVEQIAEHVLSLMKESFVIDEQEYFVTVSIGISYLTNDEKVDIKGLLHKANQALYYVKKHGRAIYKFYHSDMEHEFLNEVLMEAHLRRAIEFNELSIHFQPQFNLETEEINSLEALVRWQNRKFGSVPPSQFIPIAESSGIIIEIGYWILENVCLYIQQWQAKGYRPMRVAVNISPKQFKHANFTQTIRALLAKYNIKPQYLELEITESAMMDVNETTEILNDLKSIGVYVSVDDFGTGYSSLSYLKSYPIDIIKIDQSFIRDIEIDEKNESIIKAIILLSHTLGLEVIAEGVENQSQEAFLRKLKCEKVQGYLYNKPAPAGEIEAKYLVDV